LKRLMKRDVLLIAVAALGILGLNLRKNLYLYGTDVFGLLVKGHPLELGLWLSTLLSAALILAAVRKTEANAKVQYRASFLAALGHILLAAGILLTLLPWRPNTDFLDDLWKYSGILSAPMLVYAAIQRAQGKQPFFLVYVVCCIFFVFHLVNHYQSWCSNPQLQDYVFAFGAMLCLMLFAYQLAASGVGMGDSRIMRAVSLLGLYLCLVSVADLQDLYLYLGGAVFCGLGMCGLAEAVAPEQKAGEGDAAS